MTGRAANSFINSMRTMSFAGGLGIFCMIFCIVDWVALSLFIQSFESTSYNGPYFIRYIVNSSYFVMIIPWYILKRIYDSKHPTTSSNLHTSSMSATSAAAKHRQSPSVDSSDTSDDGSDTLTRSKKSKQHVSRALKMPYKDEQSLRAPLLRSNAKKGASSSNSSMAPIGSSNTSNVSNTSKNAPIPSNISNTSNTMNGAEFDSNDALDGLDRLDDSAALLPRGREERMKVEVGSDYELARVLMMPMIVLSGLGVLSGYAFYWCLQFITTGTANTIYQSECIYVFIFSALFLGELVTWQKCIAIFICLSGVALISYSQGSEGTSGTGFGGVFFGLVLVLSSTIAFSVLETSVNYYSNKYFRKDRKVQDTLLFQALMGLETFLLWWGVIVLLDVCGVEKFEWPDAQEWEGIMLTAVMDIIYQAAYFVGIALLNVFVMAMSSLLVIPLSFLGGIIFHNDGVPNFMSITGTVGIFVGFVLLEVPLRKMTRKLDWCESVPTWWILCGRYCCCWLNETTRRETFDMGSIANVGEVMDGKRDRSKGSYSSVGGGGGVIALSVEPAPVDAMGPVGSDAEVRGAEMNSKTESFPSKVME